MLHLLYLQPEGLQGEADLEVDKIILELTAGILGTTAAPTGKIAGQAAAAQVSKFVRLFYIYLFILFFYFFINFLSHGAMWINYLFFYVIFDK